MGITVSGLRKMNPEALDWAGWAFMRSSTSYEAGEDSFLSGVLNKINSPSVWVGAGQSDASIVMDINLSAMALGRVQMDTAWTAMRTLRSAMQKVQRALEESLDEAKQKHIEVGDDGTCEIEAGYEGHDGQGNLTSDGHDRAQAVGRIERDVKGQLAFAGLADYSVKGILDYLAVQTPQSSSTADLSVLEYNSEQLGEANALSELALENETFWDSAKPQPIPQEDPWGEIVVHLFDNPEDIGPVLRDAGITAGGIVLTLLGATAEIGSVSVSATGVGALVGVPGAIAAAGLVTVGAGVTAYGASELKNDVWELYKKSQKGKGKGGGGGKRYKPGDNKNKTRTYAKDTGAAKGKAKQYAKKEQAKGHKTVIPPVRTDKYGRADVTVSVYKKDPSSPTGWRLHHIRHFMSKTPTP